MTMTNEEHIQKLEARINELEKQVSELDGIASARLDSLEEDLPHVAKLARAVAELQEELQRKFPDLYFINKIDAPTMVGQQ
jgi:predicted  nucleic acid-binding Zn-ribbon protein